MPGWGLRVVARGGPGPRGETVGRRPRGEEGPGAEHGGGRQRRAEPGAEGVGGALPAAGESRARGSTLPSPLCAGPLPSPGRRVLGRGQLPAGPSPGGAVAAAGGD